MIEKLKKHWKIILFVLAIALGIFFRVYNFHDFLLFKGDSFRDAVAISRAYENGIGELPLMGPRAGGTHLHLGPIFYYFQYLSAEIFRSTVAPVLAYPVLLFSLLSIPLLYLFSRKFFSRNWSMFVVGVFSLCFLGIEYTRFAWNPNSASFFNLLFFFALLQIFDEKRARFKNWFSALAGLSLAVSSQLHFSNFLALPIILVLFLALNWRSVRKTIGWKAVAVFLAAIVVVYIPVILNEIVEAGANSKEFLQAISGKSSEVSFLKSLTRETEKFGKYFLRIGLGIFHPSELINYVAQVIIAIAFAINIFLWKVEKEIGKKRFLSLTAIIFAAFFVLYFPLSGEIDNPRFFIPLIIIPFIFLGYLGFFVFNFMKDKEQRKIGSVVFFVLTLLMLASNIRWSSAYMIELQKSQNQIIEQEDTLVLDAKRDRVWWSWGVFEKAARYIKKECPEGAVYYLMAKDVEDFGNSIEYALKFENLAWTPKLIKGSVHYDSAGCYFFISRADKIKPTSKVKDFTLEPAVDLGNIAVSKFQVSPLPDEPGKNLAEERMEKANNPDNDNGEDHRGYWRSVPEYFKSK